MQTSLKRRAGEVLVAVPASLALQVRSTDSRRSPLPTAVSDDVWATLPWYVRLAVRLLYVKGELGGAAPGTSADAQAVNNLRRDWAGLLPRSFDEMPIAWSEADLGALQSMRMRGAVHKIRAQYRAFYDSVCGSGSMGEAGFVSYDRFVWALQCVRSRSFAGELETAPFKERVRLFGFVGALALAGVVAGSLSPSQAANGAATAVFALAMYDVITPRILGLVGGVQLKRYSLVPGVDFLNHASRVNGTADVSCEYFTDRFVVAAGENYNAGDEVAISYGAQSNDSLLQFYGFVEDDNPADDYVFEKAIADMLGVGSQKLRAVRGVGFEPGTITEVAEARFGGDQAAAKLTLLDLAQAELTGLPTTIEEDVEKLEKLRANASPARAAELLAVQWRLEKKKVLQEAVAILGK